MKHKSNKLKTLGISALMICAALLFLCTFTENVSAQTLTVDNTGGGQFRTIRAALGAAVSGDTIVVAYGTGQYNEDTSAGALSFNFPLYIIGQMNINNQCPVVIGSNSLYPVFSLGPLAYPAQIENFGIRGGSAGIYSQAQATYANSVGLQNLQISFNYKGIVLTVDSSYHLIDGCHIYLNDNYGIDLDGSDHTVDDCGNTYVVNTGIFNNGAAGIHSDDLKRTTISDSNIYSNDGSGIYITGNSITIDNVEIWENDGHGLYLNGINNLMDGKGSRKIYDNKKGYLYDPDITASHVLITGSAIIQNYKVYHPSEPDSDGEVGITCGSSVSPFIEVKNCKVYQFRGEETEGIFLAQNNKISGSDTEIHDCTIGVYALNNALIDCGHTTSYTYNDCTSSGSLRNIYLNIENDDDEFGYGVYAVGDNVMIRNTFFMSCTLGISTYADSYNDDIDVDNCYFYLTTKGIILDTTQNSDIDGCIFAGNEDGCIWLDNADQNSIDGSLFFNGDVGIFIDEDSSQNTIDDCEFEKYFQQGYYTAIYIDEGSNNDITDCNFDHCSWGVKIIGDGSTTGGFNTVENCVFEDDEKELTTDVGILCDYLNFSYLLENDFSDLGKAIHLKGAKNVDIYGDSSTPSTIHDCIYALRAEPSNSQGCEDGEMKDYDLDRDDLAAAMIIYLKGASSTSKTNFEYSGITGTTGTDYTVTVITPHASWSPPE